MYYQVPEFQTIVGPSPLAVRETRIMLAPVVMITTLHVIDATYLQMLSAKLSQLWKMLKFQVTRKVK